MKTKEEILEKYLGSFWEMDDLHPNEWLKAMEEYANQDKWISVKDRLPDATPDKGISEPVFICYEQEGRTNIIISGYDHKDKVWFGMWSRDIVTHWQPLPELPKK